MFIAKMVVQNWRNFKNIDIEFNERLFIVGPNACGKSNFLDIFRFLKDISINGGLQKALEHRGGITRIRSLHARSIPEISFKFFFKNNLRDTEYNYTYELTIKKERSGSRRELITKEIVFKNNKKILNRPDAKDQQDPIRLFDTHLENKNTNEDFREIATFFSKVEYLHIVPQLVRTPQVLFLASLQNDPYGSTFLQKLAKTPEKTRNARLSQIEQNLKTIIPNLKDFKFVNDTTTGTPHLETTFNHWRPKAGKQTELDLSDGTLRLIGLLWSIIDSDRLLLLEEPELSLNSSIVTKLPSVFYNLTKKKKRQIFVSTHSSELLSDTTIDASEILIMTPTHEGTTVQLAKDDNEFVDASIAGFTAPEILQPRFEIEENIDID